MTVFVSFRPTSRNLSILIILYWGLCNPKPRTKYSFFFIAKKKERTLDKKEKQRRLKTVTKFNPKLVNSLSLRQHEFFIVSLSDCRLIVISANLICHCEIFDFEAI